MLQSTPPISWHVFQSLHSLVIALLVSVLVALPPAAVQADTYVQAPDFTLKRSTGEAVTLSSLRGNVVIVVFWATWCPYCKKLLPGIQKLVDFYEGGKFKVLAVDIWDEGDTDVYMKQHGLNLDVLLHGDDVAGQWGVRGTPTTFVINVDGNIIYGTHNSDPDNPELASVVERALNETSAE